MELWKTRKLKDLRFGIFFYRSVNAVTHFFDKTPLVWVFRSILKISPVSVVQILLLFHCFTCELLKLWEKTVHACNKNKSLPKTFAE